MVGWGRLQENPVESERLNPFTFGECSTRPPADLPGVTGQRPQALSHAPCLKISRHFPFFSVLIMENLVASKLHLFRSHITASAKCNVYLGFYILLTFRFPVYNNKIFCDIGLSVLRNWTCLVQAFLAGREDRDWSGSLLCSFWVCGQVFVRPPPDNSEFYYLCYYSQLLCPLEV